MKEVKDFKEGITKQLSAFYFKTDNKIENHEYMDYSVQLADLSSYDDKEDYFLGNKIPSPKIAAIFKTDSYVYCAARSGIKHGDHAEFTILNSMLNKYIVKETDTLFTTLEPCTPESRSKWTESCTELIINKKIKNVYIGTLDANPLVFGCGVNSLLKNGIDVKFYDKKSRDKLQEINKDFFDFCQHYPDISLLKRVDKFLKNYIDEEALKIYYKIQKVTDETFIQFYREMIASNQITEGNLNGSIQISKELALAFTKNPSYFIPGYNFGIIIRNNQYNFYDEQKNKRIIFDSSLLKLCGTASKENIFFEIIKRISGLDLQMENFDDMDVLYRKFLIDLRYFREYFINALVHNNYENNIGVTIEIGNKEKISYIKLINILSNNINVISKNDAILLADKFNNKELLSIPTNPILMQFFVRSRLAENSGFGFGDVNNVNVQYDVLNQNGVNILETYIAK